MNKTNHFDFMQNINNGIMLCHVHYALNTSWNRSILTYIIIHIFKRHFLFQRYIFENDSWPQANITFVTNLKERSSKFKIFKQHDNLKIKVTFFQIELTITGTPWKKIQEHLWIWISDGMGLIKNLII